MLKSGVIAERRFSSQHVVVMLREPVRLVANRLQQTQRERAAAQLERLFPVGNVNFLVAFGQRNNEARAASGAFQSGERGVKLAFAAVDQKNVGGRAVRVDDGEPARNRFRNGGEVVDSIDRSNFVTPITVFERATVDEMNERRDCVPTAEVRDIDSFDHSGRFGKFKDFLQA